MAAPRGASPSGQARPQLNPGGSAAAQTTVPQQGGQGAGTPSWQSLVAHLHGVAVMLPAAAPGTTGGAPAHAAALGQQ
eukprot:1092658-Ditylum_brightwellii.AAC.2